MPLELMDLGDELLYLCFSFLEAQELSRAALTCKNALSITELDVRLWRFHCVQASLEFPFQSDSATAWRDEFVDHYYQICSRCALKSTLPRMHRCCGCEGSFCSECTPRCPACFQYNCLDCSNALVKSRKEPNPYSNPLRELIAATQENDSTSQSQITPKPDIIQTLFLSTGEQVEYSCGWTRCPLLGYEPQAPEIDMEAFLQDREDETGILAEALEVLSRAREARELHDTDSDPAYEYDDDW